MLADFEVTMGMDREEHECGGAEECDCEVRSFSMSACEGCGSDLGGERYAMTIWEREA
jgi:hypothetical protein